MARKKKTTIKKGTRASTVKNRKRRGQSAIKIWAKRAVVALCLFLAIAAPIAWAVHSGALERAKDRAWRGILDKTAEAGWVVETVLVEGRENTDPVMLKSIINIEKGDPTLSFDPYRVRAEIMEIPWIEDVQTARRFPGTIYVRLIEKKPVAIWHFKDKALLIDKAGAIITNEGLSRFSDLPEIYGAAAPEHFGALLDILSAQEKIKARVTEARWAGERRWDLTLGDILVKFPAENTALALEQLADMQGKDAILEKDLEYIDLRDASRIMVKKRSGSSQGAAQQYNFPSGSSQKI